MGHITIIAHDQVRARMAAPSIRAVEMARGLAVHGHVVTLAIPNQPEIDLSPIRQIRDDGPELTAAIRTSDVVITGGGPYAESWESIPSHIAHVADMSFPLLLEGLAMHGADPQSWPEGRLRSFAKLMSDRLLGADLLLCASQEQRHFYLGCLAALGRVTGRVIEQDPALDHLLRVVPFGCSSAVATATGGGPRSSIEGISASDYVLIWSGNVADWYDPEMVIRAVSAASKDASDVRLVFIGANAQGERLGRTPTGTRARELAERLGLVGRHVFFWDDWVPYEQRADWLLSSDAAVIASPRTLEAELAVRARCLDYVWCATPLITTRGGTYAEAVSRSGLGLVVEPGDVPAMSNAITTMADASVRDGMRAQLQAIRPAYEWSRTLAPLFDYCASPTLAPDKRAGEVDRARPEPNGHRRRWLQHLVGRARVQGGRSAERKL
jgi:glycosyltransferase involved in cell wall biosynthesis